MRKQIIVASVTGALALGSITPSYAQNRDSAYYGDLLQLAQVLGAVHYLRDLCGANDGQLWRNKMLELLEVDEPVEGQRRRLIAQFNEGFNGMRDAFVACTKTSSEAAARYIEEGGDLASKLARRLASSGDSEETSAAQ